MLFLFICIKFVSDARKPVSRTASSIASGAWGKCVTLLDAPLEGVEDNAAQMGDKQPRWYFMSFCYASTETMRPGMTFFSDITISNCTSVQVCNLVIKVQVSLITKRVVCNLPGSRACE